MNPISVVEDRREPTAVIDYMKLPLTGGQRRVVEMDRLDRHVLVVAPPGSGKTLTITRRIAHLLSCGLASTEQILALTFTERAANELATRLGKMTLTGVSAGTFHGRCSAILREEAARIGHGPPPVLWTQQQQIVAIREAAGLAGMPRLDDRQAGKVKAALSRWKCSRLRIEDVVKESGFNVALTERMFDGYAEILRGSSAVDFDDLIIQAADLLWDDPEVARRIQNRFRFVFIDEFQDVSPEQYRFLRALAPPGLDNRQVIIVADGNQSIFGFRGADPRKMIGQFRADYRPLEVTLRQNHRSVASIVNAAHALMEASGARELSRSVRNAGFPIDCFVTASAEDEAELIVDLVKAALARGRHLNEMAILFRSHKRADLIEARLLHNGLGLHRVKKDRFYDQPAVQEIIRYFELVASTHGRSFTSAVNWPRFLVDELTMNDLRRVAADAGVTIADLAGSPELLRATATPLTATTVERFMHEVVGQVRASTAQPARAVVDQMLDLLECRRDPIPRTVRESFRATLDELGRGLETSSDVLFEAIQARRSIVVLHDSHPDSAMAAALLRRVLPGYLGAQVQDFGTESEPPVVVALGETTYPTSAHIRLVSDQSASGGFTVTARAYRLCQLVLMRYEHLAAGRFVVFDVETTSNRSETAEILDIGAVVVEDGKVTGRTFGTLVRPSSAEAITLDAANVHGLGWDHVRNAPAPVDVLARFLEFAGDATLVGHNIQRFDFPVLARACDRAGLDSPRNLLLDTLLLARRLRPGMLNALDDLLTPSELQARRGRHEALLDAGLTAQVFVRLLNHLGREKEIDVLTEELPVVAASIHARNAESTPDNMLLASIGARAHRFGMGQHPPSEPVTWLAQVEYTHLVEQLRKSDPGNEPDDNAWERLRAGWRDVVGTFEATLRDQTLEGLIEFVALATPSDLDSGDAERISMMSVYSAKGHEWPVVFLIGVEDDQYPFSSNAQENEVEEGRRALYVGMNRAGDRLILTWARVVDGKPRAPSRFLADMQGHVAFHERSRSVHA